jgi:hypothetical protein
MRPVNASGGNSGGNPVHFGSMLRTGLARRELIVARPETIMNSPRPLLAPDAETHPGYAHQRAEERSNMFVMATFYCERGSFPVRVRNMSRGGALIESAAIPLEESRVRLSRGSFSVRGQIIWRDDKRAGVRFDADVEVGDWLPGVNRPSHQQRIDQIVEECRDHPVAGAEPAASSSFGQATAIGQLLDLRDMINGIAELLAGDTQIAIAHATALQKLDIAAHSLDTLASALARPA